MFVLNSVVKQGVNNEEKAVSRQSRSYLPDSSVWDFSYESQYGKSVVFNVKEENG
jgi:hypothetical protein